MLGCTAPTATRTPYLLVMELVEGRELFDAILSRGKFDEPSARNIFSKLCQAVAYMHARNIIHRDVKPENVLVTGVNEDEVKLVDFGLSKLVAEHGRRESRTYHGRDALVPSSGNREHEDQDPVAGLTYVIQRRRFGSVRMVSERTTTR